MLPLHIIETEFYQDFAPTCIPKKMRMSRRTLTTRIEEKYVRLFKSCILAQSDNKLYNCLMTLCMHSLKCTACF